MKNKYKLGYCGNIGGTVNPVLGIQGRLAVGVGRHGEAKSIFQAKTLLWRQKKVQYPRGTLANSVELHNNEQGL